MFNLPLNLPGAIADLYKSGGDYGKAANTLFRGADITPGFNISRTGLQSTAPKATGGTTSTQLQPLAETYNDSGSTQQQNGGYSTYTGGYSTYTGGASGASSGYAPAIDSAAIGEYDQGIGITQDALNRLASQLGIATGNIDRNYSTKVNELEGQKTSNQNTYNTSTTQNQQQYRTNKNSINDQTSAGLRGLMRQLGAYGAVGSDLQVASGAVNDVASAQRSGSGQTFAQNQQGLDTGWNNYLGEWGNSKKKADDWRTEQRNSAEQQSLTGRQDLLTRLADLRGKRAAAAGGNYAGGAAGDLATARGLSGKIDQLGAINPTYNGTGPAYNQRALDSYMAPQAQQASIRGTGTSSANPFLAQLLGQDEEKKQLV